MLRVTCFLLLSLVSSIALSQTPAAKRPLKHADYEIWNTATAMTLSPDGKWLAYNRLPGEGDGAVIVKSLTGPTEYVIPRGGRTGGATAERPEGEPSAVPAASAAPVGSLAGSPQFTPDGKKVLFPVMPTKAEQERAKADKKEARTVLAVMNLATGQIGERLVKLKAYSVVEKTNFLLLHEEPKTTDVTGVGAVIGGFGFIPRPGAITPTTPSAGTTPNATPGGRNRQRPGGGTPNPATTPPPSTTPRLPIGTNLTVRNLADSKEHTFTDVLDYQVTRDGKTLLLTKVSRDAADNGLFAVELGSSSLKPVLTGKGKYTRQVWDAKQSRLAFFFEEPAPEAKPEDKKPTPRPKVYSWDRSSKAPAVELLNAATPGLKAGTMIVERGGLRFTDDGLKLVLATAKIPEEKKDAPTTPPAQATPTNEKVDLDLWHWKDDQIQPMQKIRGDNERTRTHSAAYFFDTKQFRQLSDENITVGVPDFGDWSTASNDKPYRHLIGYGATLADHSLVNVRTGETKPLLKAHEGIVAASPKGNYRVLFDGKDWVSYAVPSRTKANLTAKMPVKFFNETFDMPMKPSSYGFADWTPDEKFLLVSDRFDIWKVAPDGSSCENLTKIGREQNVRFDIARFPNPDEEPDRGVDLSKPLLLNATNLVTKDSGFYWLEPGGKPKLLLMAGRDYGRPVKARHADTLLFTSSTFADYPDYYATDSTFHDVRRVTDINPRKKEFVWGKSELVAYKSLDGTELSGILVKPENFDPTKKYPMIVYIYERLTDNLHQFRLPSAGTSINPTFYASNGYLVFMPDIAYTVGSPGQSALKCVLPAIQAVVDKGCVNEQAIGIQGHSWGGYQIAYLVTQTNRFKAAASGAPVSDMVSAYGGIRWGTGLPREFQYERTQSRIGATLWQAPMKFIENSPIFMADRVQTPLMILHNDQDDAVPWYQGIEYYLALRRLGKECYLFNYNGELHGLRKKATQRDYTLRMQQFFDHHLKGAPAPEWMAKGIPFSERDKEKEQWKDLFKPSR
ncbi:alpha/beta hydrolase family protein [Limnoglobus roseus]|uniref:S9 family peptidase n=1 Tax=Limnoglobus roseus TaxID=2598579 RepID=A0A5C1AMU8_9BACT|nr:prolyl oligopeptidase family serine peptidase [Limnoglobus roseus]QEL19052.1 S9 family peptidase [Limnoglobus roseus]